MSPSARSLHTARKTKEKDPYRQIYVYIEGEKTEDQYVDFLKKNLTSRNVRIETEAPGSARRTLYASGKDKLKDLVKESKKLKVSRDSLGEVWILCDVDDEGDTLKQLLTETRDIAGGGLSWGISNPCFEVWIGMHEDGLITNKPLHRSEIQRRAKEKGLTSGKDGKHIELDMLLGKYKAARKRAIELDNHHSANSTDFPHNSPSSTMHNFVDLLTAICEKSCSEKGIEFISTI